MHFTTLALIALSGAPSVLASPLLAERAVVSTSTSCTATVPQPTPQPLICGQEGRLRNVKAYLSTSPDNMFNSAEECYQSCRTMSSNNKDCLTFAYNSKNGTCMYYSKSIKSQDFIVDQSTNEVFYNNRCWRNKCKTTKSTISADSTSTTSTKTSSIKSTKTSSIKSTKTSSVKSTKTSSVKSTKTSSVKSTSTKVSSTKTSSTTPTSTSVTTTSTTVSSTKATSTKATSTKATSCPSGTALSNTACQTAKVNLLAGTDTLTYTSYFSGSGVTENENNPGNLLNGVLTRTVYEFNSTISACDAVSQCAGEASLLGLADVAQSFDLHLVEDSNGGCLNWECVTYGGGNTDTSQFNVNNNTIKVVFGYSGTIAGISLPV